MQSNDFQQPPWAVYGSSQQQSPVNQIPSYQGFGYGPSPIMRMDPSYSVSIPPPYTSLPLALSSQPWPSMLATQPHFLDPTIPPPPPPQAQTSTSIPIPQSVPSIRKSLSGASTPRRTLTDEDRRRMCLYHVENKSAKQTDIGAIFGVERSTVSKVLRQKEKYLNLKNGHPSPAKKPKGKVPDIEKAVYNWVVKRQQQGAPLTNGSIREKALRFASTCGNIEKEKVMSPSWIPKFKRKYNITGIPSRKGSLDAKSQPQSPTNNSNSSSGDSSTVHTPITVFPASPCASPLTPTQIQEGLQKETASGLPPADDNDFLNGSSTLENSSNFSSGVTSPSTMVSDSPFTPTSQSSIPSMGSDSQRPRSQTFPFAAVDPSFIAADPAFNQISPKASQQRSLSVAGLQPPFEEGDRRNINLNTSVTFECNKSDIEGNSQSFSPPVLQTKTFSPVSPPGSPTQYEARQALELVMNYFQHQPSGLGAQDYMTISKLMQRLEIVKNHPHLLPGGLSSIEEQHGSPQLNKKRSIHTLS